MNVRQMWKARIEGREIPAAPPLATFRDGVAGQAVIDAMRESSRESRWVEVPRTR